MLHLPTRPIMASFHPPTSSNSHPDSYFNNPNNPNGSPESDSSTGSSELVGSESLGDSGTLEGLPISTAISSGSNLLGKESNLQEQTAGLLQKNAELMERQTSGENGVDISNLSVQGTAQTQSLLSASSGLSGSGTEAIGGISKVRRASSVSTGSSESITTIERDNRNGPVDGGHREEDGLPGSWGGKGIRDSKPARKKVARMETFEQIQIDSTASSSTLPPPTSATEPEHINIVSYPSGDLIKLIAMLLEQIAGANDLQNQQVARTSTESGTNTPSGVVGNEGQSNGVNGRKSEETVDGLERGRFDAAPLNSPVTPLTVPSRPSPQTNGVLEGMATGEDLLPITPGVDLLREVSDSGLENKNGFIPSLGGAHAPMPLSRRRGSSFKSKEPPLTSLLTASALALASPSATLCFHARNIPAIGIEAYLLRILKYCPTTNEVFLALLVYFDRMARVGLEAQRVVKEGGTEEIVPRLFAIDSFNVHRLVIAGVTVASKFFSDVFYTNSRYAKVGGLPLVELNQLELQFLLLNDFRLVVPVDELQRYADQLILFWVGRNSSSTSLPPLSMASLAAASATAPPNPTAISTEVRPEEGGSNSTPFPKSSTASFPIEIDHRPNVERTPSSAGTSVTSTITPGSATPTTPRGSEYGEGEEEPDTMMED